MKTRTIFLVLLSVLCSHIADDSAPTPAEAKELDAAKAAALKEPAVKAASEKYNAARKAYQLDRAKFPAERSPEVAAAFRKATKELEEGTRKAILARDPSPPCWPRAIRSRDPWITRCRC